MRVPLLDRVDPGTGGLVLVLAGSAVAWVVGSLLAFVVSPSDAAVAFALLGFVGLAALVAVIWGVYFGIQVLRHVEAGRRNAALAAVVIGAVTLVPWLISILGLGP